MKLQSKADILFRTLKIYGRLSSTWPPDPGVKKQEIIFYELCWWLTFLNVISLLIPLILGVYHFRNNIDVLSQAASELTALMEVFFNMIICKLQSSRLQKEANDLEKSVIEKYAKRYFSFQAFLGTSFFLTGIAFSCCPILTSALLPANAWYPFSIESFPTRFLIYTLQVLAITQTALCVCVDFTVITLFWYLSARLELLQEELMNMSTEIDMRNSIRKHQELIEFFDEVSKTVRFLIIKSSFTMTVTVVFSALELLGHASLTVISKSILMVFSACLRLYVTSWAADDLKEQSVKVAESMYQSSWVDKSLKIQKSITIVIIRSQKPFIISATGIISAFSLEYYASFLATSLNYFMKARAVVG